MKKTVKHAQDRDDAPLSRRELATARPLAEVFPDLAAYSRKRALKGERIKQAVSLRLSPEVLDYFKAGGAGWQTRMDKALKLFVHIARGA